MEFQLTEELEDRILREMENQEQKFLIDAKNCILVPFESAVDDEQNYYRLPEWNSSLGFSLREDFVNELKSPFAKEELRKILHSGRGVFKGFKNVLKDYPLIEKSWHRFKNHRMLDCVRQWYNQLRDIWGLEKLEPDPENLDHLIEEDFIFQEFDSSKDESFILHDFFSAAKYEFSDIMNIDEQKVFGRIIENSFMEGCSKEQTGIVCRTLSDEFAGCISSMPVLNAGSENMLITMFYVVPQFRGLGIGSRLLLQYLKSLKMNGKKSIALTYSLMPDVLEPFLLSSGFRKIGSGFFLEIK